MLIPDLQTLVAKSMSPEKWTLNSFFLFLLFQSCSSNDTITPTQPITDGEILVSEGESFALGFFSPGSSTDRYVGIWYNKVSEQTVVWVANRENPIKDSSAVLMINADGNLVLLYRNQSNLLWSTNLTVSTNDSIAKLSNSGNLILLQRNSKTILWQSFDYPTHIFLPGMKLGLNRKTGLNWLLTSWKSNNDPARGNYTFGLDPEGSPEFFLYKNSARYWRSGPWTGHGWSGVPAMTLSYMFKYSFVNNQDGIYMNYSLYNGSIFSKFVLDESGSVQRLTWVDGIRRWNLFWSAPEDRCDDYDFCGPYGYCSSNSELECRCLPGFEPKSGKDWYYRDGLGGCVRKRASRCEKGEGFLKVARVKLPDSSMARVDKGLSLHECEKQCLSNCSCTAFASADVNRGGSGCVVWYGELMDIRDYPDWGQDLYVRVDAIELAANTRRNSKGVLGKKWSLVILIVSIVVGLFLFVFCGCYFLNKKRRTKATMERRHEQLFKNSPSAKELEQIRPNSELPFFDLSILVAATDNFSSINLLGKGGFGPVYKGQLSNGNEIAVKRLSQNSGQGIEELKNEVTLIAKLQHRNLVRLLGCCIQDDDKILIYEYLPNKSLDFFIFDQTKKALLDWRKRFDIIVGIARGVLYLHQDSRLRIIHRDLKASNVLLDAELNPKISDFGMARIFGGNQTEANTNKVVGTYGYMAPEYALYGLFSTKSDVFSFGVLLLEIISGQKNNGYYHEDPSWNLIGHAWDLWNEDKALDLVDSSIVDTCPAHEVLRCIHVGFLCVQEIAKDRPTMSMVVFMLGNETTLLPPKQPAYIIRTRDGAESSSTQTGKCTVNEETITMVEAR